MKCNWCDNKGVQIGKSWGNIIIAKCTKCHHEWECNGTKGIDFLESTKEAKEKIWGLIASLYKLK